MTATARQQLGIIAPLTVIMPSRFPYWDEVDRRAAAVQTIEQLRRYEEWHEANRPTWEAMDQAERAAMDREVRVFDVAVHLIKVRWVRTCPVGLRWRFGRQLHELRVAAQHGIEVLRRLLHELVESSAGEPAPIASHPSSLDLQPLVSLIASLAAAARTWADDLPRRFDALCAGGKSARFAPLN